MDAHEGEQELFDELIAMRQSKPCEILKWRGKIITLVTCGFTA